MSGPVSAVLAAFEGGAVSVDEAARRVGTSRELAQAAVDELIRMGRLDARELAVGCPSAGCGSCASGIAGSPGCGASAPSSQRQGPVLVALIVHRRDARREIRPET
ncbi:MAG: FeoC-like transcriptional regulator [Nocardioides sp.]